MAQSRVAPAPRKTSVVAATADLPTSAADSVSVLTWEPFDLRKALVVVGFPSFGLASSIATSYLIDSLHLREIGGVVASSFPPAAVVQDGVASSPVRIFVGDVTCGPGGRCEQLCVVHSNMAPKPSILTPVARAVVAWAKEHGAQEVVCLEGFKQEAGSAAETRIFGAASDPQGREMLGMIKVAPYADGLLAGFGGVALYAARAIGQPALCFLVETRQGFPDARGAARLLETLKPLVPLVKINERPLLEQAEIIEAVSRDQRAKASRAERDLSPPEDVMFG